MNKKWLLGGGLLAGGAFCVIVSSVYLEHRVEVVMPLAYTGIERKSIGHHLDANDVFLTHSDTASAEDRPRFSCGYVPPVPFTLEKAGIHPNWQHAMQCVQDGAQRSAHFLLDAIDVIDKTGEIGVVIYVANEQAKQAGTYTLRIEIAQKRPDSLVTVYDESGAELTGPLPLRPKKKRGVKKPYLPWLDGMRQFYSVVCEKRDGTVYLILIQHSKEEIHEYDHTSPIVNDMVEHYSDHERLQNRPGAYLDMSLNMRCLPVPYANQKYELLGDGPLYVSWATLVGTIEILPG
ncbi:MAG: hypothetical protein QG604_387 [Candidatus Dependentiae bacterium]|nr:hypothetical protein [Candidatus Dependentiae bacterium]